VPNTQTAALLTALSFSKLQDSPQLVAAIVKVMLDAAVPVKEADFHPEIDPKQETLAREDYKGGFVRYLTPLVQQQLLTFLGRHRWNWRRWT
jgi:hypothetical protein